MIRGHPPLIGFGSFLIKLEYHVNLCCLHLYCENQSSYNCNTLIAYYTIRRCVNLFRYCYLYLMSTGCLCEHARARARAYACARWMQVGLTTLKGAWPRRPVRTLRPRPRPHLRPRPRVVYPVFCLNANGSRRVDVSTRTEPVGRRRRRSTVRGKANARF